ncbi:hypothetical protein MCC93_25720 [Morococcus cerebrosus]|uniref:Uncharacterized protein n=1 Tax=Morococcus cerebrosus TaxID=1056807 RepID=A0A0C1GH51_9NEIS|nr:hypothetical protein MCC93_25720 [Morococcus cerebrosus]
MKAKQRSSENPKQGFQTTFFYIGLNGTGFAFRTCSVSQTHDSNKTL